MNTGIISTRYAKALLRYTEETGGGARVCAQVQQLLSGRDTDTVKLEPELERFAALLHKNGRIEDVRFIFRSFVAMYYQSRGIKLAQLTTIEPASEKLVQTLHDLLEKQFGSKVLLETGVNPEILGGFIIEIGDEILDASVLRQIETLRRQFVIKCNRIV